MTAILISAIGGDVAQAAASIIRDAYPNWTIIGTDQHGEHAGALYADHVLTIPPARREDYTERLHAIIRDCSIDYFLPMSEAELLALAQGSISAIGSARIIWAGDCAITIGCDKLKTSQFLTSIGIPAPWTLPATEDVEPPSFPCIFKLRRSSGSKSIFLCRTTDEVHFYRARHMDAVIQEFIPDYGGEVTCALYRTRSKETFVLQMLRHLTGGLTSWATIIDNAQIKHQCEAIAGALELQGAINVQLRLTEAGPRVFEINPRYSSTVLMRHLAGFSDLTWALEEALGRSLRPSMPSPGLVLVRTQGAAILPSESAYAPSR